MTKQTNAQNSKPGGGSAYTPPKGRPTPGRREYQEKVQKRTKSARRVRWEWTIFVGVLAVIVALLFVFFGDSFPDGGSMLPGNSN